MTTPGGNDLLVRAAIDDELTRPLTNIRRELRQTGDTAEVAGRKASRASRGFDVMAGGVARLTRTAGRTAVLALGGLATAAGIATAGVVTMGIKAASANQQAMISFTTMLGSAKKAGAFLKDLKKFAAATPFEFPELQTAASSLISAGIEAGKVIPIMRTLGDVTSGMGTGSEGVKRATIALQQMSAAGRITGEDLNQLRDAGIPVYDLLAKATGKSKAQVVELAQAGKLGKKELGQMMTALETGKGLERFSGLMDKQSQSLAGVWSTLKDTVSQTLGDALTPAIPTLTTLIGKLGTFAGTAIPAATKRIGELYRTGADFVDTFRKFGLDGVVTQLDNMTGANGRLNDALRIAKGIVGDVKTVLTESLLPAIQDVTTAISPAWLTPLGLARAALGFLADHTTTARVAIVGLVTVLAAARAMTIVSTVATTAMSAAQFIATARTYGLSYALKAGGAAAKAYTAVQWLLNAALNANPISLVVIAIAALAAGFILLWKHSETFRKIATAAFVFVGKAVLTYVDFALWGIEKMLEAWSHLPKWLGGGKATDALNAVRKMRAGIQGMKDDLDKLTKPVVIPIVVQAQQAGVAAAKAVKAGGGTVKQQQIAAGAASKLARQDAALGDTRSSRARGNGNLGRTLAAHARYSAETGARARITNALTGGGGLGRGSGDHQRGKALDLRGSGLAAYAAAVRRDGGYADFHGAGAGRHLHAVPAGDTGTSRARTPARQLAGVGAGGVTIEAGAIVVYADGLTADEAERVATRAITNYIEAREERS